MSVVYMLFETSLGTCALSWRDELVVSMSLPSTSAKAIEARLKKDGAMKQADPPKWVLRAAKAVAA
ncbi:MAG: cysteine methyltransferase, partial [Polyangiaceae bacterium]